MSDHYLVTGGSGFIGAALVKRLLVAGHHVRVLDDNSRGDSANLAEVKNHVEFVQADIRDRDAVLKAAHGIDSLVHLAAIILLILTPNEVPIR